MQVKWEVYQLVHGQLGIGRACRVGSTVREVEVNMVRIVMLRVKE